MVNLRWVGPRAFRPAFTLVELLIAISIIAILLGIGYAVYWGTITSTQTSTTTSMLKKLQIPLDKQWAAVGANARQQPLPAAFPGKTGTNPDQDLATWVSLCQRQAFPRTFAQVLTPTASQLTPLPAHTTYFAQSGITTPIPITVQNYQALESSICLLMALRRSPYGTGFNPEDLGKASIKSFTLPGVSQPVEALVDAWGQPIWFALQPTTVSGSMSMPSPILISAGADNAFQSTITDSSFSVSKVIPPTTPSDLASK